MKRNFAELLYTTFLHNDFAIACAVGIVLALFLLLKKPSRRGVLLLVGFGVLLLRFQYLKHIVEPLLDQTTGVLLREEAAGGSRKLFVLLNILVPFGMYLAGWGSLFLALIAPELRFKKFSQASHPEK